MWGWIKKGKAIMIFWRWKKESRMSKEQDDTSSKE